MYWMFDTRSRGDSGTMSQAYWFDNGEVKVEENARPRVGVVMRVGSHYARSFQHQDWWQTTMITEIVSETDNEIVFKTKNSTYTWRKL